MSMETYTLVVREMDTSDGIDADVRDEDGLVAASTRVTYADYDLEVDREDDGPAAIEEAFTADVLSLSLQFQRDDRGFEFRVIGDDRELARATVDDAAWELRPLEE